MIGIVILNAVFVAIVLAGVLGILAWGIVSSMERPDRWPGRSVRAPRRRLIAESKLHENGRQPAPSLPLVHADDRQ